MWHQDQENGRLIGHMILKKGHGESGLQESSSFVGVHVVGGKMKEAGKLGAFISRVKQGSIADTVGQLRAGKVLYLCGLSKNNVKDTQQDSSYGRLLTCGHNSSVDDVVGS